MIMKKIPLKKITSFVSVTNLCNLYKYSGIVMYYSMCTLIGLCLTIFLLTSDNYSTKIDFALVISFILIGQVLRILFLTMSLY